MRALEELDVDVRQEAPAPLAGQEAEHVLRRIRLRAQRRALWLRKLWSEEEPPGGKLAITHGEIDTLLADRDAPEAEHEWFATDPEARALTAEIEKLEAWRGCPSPSRLDRLQLLFELDAGERDTLEACFAVAVDPSLARIYAYLQDIAARSYVTRELVARLFGFGRTLRLGSETALLRWRLVVEQEIGPGEPRALACDPVVVDWLLGKARLDAELQEVARIQPVLAPLRGWPVKEVARRLGAAPGERDVVASPRVRIVGPPGSGRRTLAACVSAELGRPLLVVETAGLDLADAPALQMLALRQARMNGYALAWGGDLAERSPCRSLAGVAQFLVCEPGATPTPPPGLVDRVLDMPVPSMEERRALLHRTVPASPRWDPRRTEELVGRHRLTVGVIDKLARARVETLEDAVVLVCESTRERLGDLVQVLECPFGWDDLVVPDRLREQLEDLVFEAKESASFWEDPRARRLFPQGRGVFALLSGPPGVGKTMACQVVAAALGRDLYAINLAALTSKWVGDTAKNLSRALSQVPNDEVLLFDEADAAFGRRLNLSDGNADANARFLNTDTAHVLQIMESYRGVVLMTTNRKSNLDPAFMRRLRYVLDIAKPGEQARLQIWNSVNADLLGHTDPGSRSAVAEIIRNVDLTGAQLKSAAMTALLKARRSHCQVASNHVRKGVEDELRKEGRCRDRPEKHA